MIPNATTLIGCLMLGNLVRKINIVPKLVENLQQEKPTNFLLMHTMGPML
ncbi:oxaloacetate decarboxylase beta chain / methylmalonyl-CoA decarboxylase, beta chain [Streptococcus equi subsp. zooepidemicus MGCS10565]|uniref:Oxaloacetate decarboxylase beta chain / methylmalonyl-CoA decarboxylase, beta chain n=1 Tax=Streptococcus equi subsp. zooepidemicus (strain MGCS10565) TaxID=552526 RepID=B4U2X3_STREM|nr:oxaloacetate decarboxylase beta chain / methylmalonyl-CoA decarboxylase, beta chain [Streptococcus equi subsp. zooepidemicus MGCS10565]